MENDQSYNGWTNRATWLVNLWAGEYLSQYVRDTVGQEIDATQAESFVDDWLENTSGKGLALDLVNHALGQVDWQEIADAANE